ncbi:metallophosphoesterase family protein [Crateriforma spongiae]|uniref:metallophosphoesterase family protein n=1 Tax=Crateriforma spongiae TaxID=2724528 RepID=UPI0039AF5707
MHSPALSRRRLFPVLAAGSITIASSALSEVPVAGAPVTFGLIADPHVGLAKDAQDRLGMFLDRMSTASPDSLIQLGDFAFPEPRHQRLVDSFNEITKHPIHVIGNHDLDFGHTPDACVESWGIPGLFYRHDVGPLCVLVLDGNDKGSPTHDQHGGYPSYVGPEQLEWLDQSLADADRPVVVCSHQPLAGRAAVDNADAVREILEAHRRKVVLCLNGHTHIDQLLEISGIPYLHVNSASYHWVGGPRKWVSYADPLFATLVVDPFKRLVTIQGRSSHWVGDPPAEAEQDSSNAIVPQIRSRSIIAG